MSACKHFWVLSYPFQISAGNVFNQAAFNSPLLCRGMFGFSLKKDYEKASSCVPPFFFFFFFLPASLQIMVGRRKNMFTMLSHPLSLSLPKLTAHHKSISARRKSISRLPFLSRQKNVLFLKKKKGGGGGGSEGGAGAERRGGKRRENEEAQRELFIFCLESKFV